MIESSKYHAKIGDSFIEDKNQKEIKYFDVQEVLDEIELIAKEEGITSEDFDLDHVEVFYNETGQLTYLRVLVNEDFVHARGCGNISYVYMIKGDHGGEVGEMLQTNISRLESDISTPEDFSKIDIVARYFQDKNKWVAMNNNGEKPVRFRMKAAKLKESKNLKKLLGE